MPFVFQGSLTADAHFLIPGLQKAIIVADHDAQWKLKDILLSCCELLGRWVNICMYLCHYYYFYRNALQSKMLFICSLSDSTTNPIYIFFYIT